MKWPLRGAAPSPRSVPRCRVRAADPTRCRRAAAGTALRLALGAALLFALPALTGLPGGTAQAQTTQVSNIGNARIGPQNLNTYAQTQVFGTGSNAGGYLLTGIDIELSRIREGSATHVVNIKKSSGGIPTGPVLATLSAESAINASDTWSFTHPGAGLRLDANTEYNAVIEPVAGSVVQIRITADLSEHTAKPGWFIANSSREWRGVWNTYDRNSWLMAVKGVALPVFDADLLSLFTRSDRVFVYEKGEAMPTLTLPSATGEGTVSYSFSPELPPGLSIDLGTRQITGTPTVNQAPVDYTWTASLSDGGSVSVTFPIAVAPAGAPGSLSFYPSPVVEGSRAVIIWTQRSAPSSSGNGHPDFGTGAPANVANPEDYAIGGVQGARSFTISSVANNRLAGILLETFEDDDKIDEVVLVQDLRPQLRATSATVTILDNDFPAATISLDRTSVSENYNTSVLLTVTLAEPAPRRLDFLLEPSGSAVYAKDYSFGKGCPGDRILIAKGDTTPEQKTCIVVNQDANTVDDTVTFSLPAEIPISTGGTRSVTLTITDDGEAKADMLLMKATPNPVDEGETLRLTVGLSQALPEAVTLIANFRHLISDAEFADFDWGSTPQCRSGGCKSVVVPAGATTATIDLPTVPDDDLDDEEAVFLPLGPTNVLYDERLDYDLDVTIRDNKGALVSNIRETASTGRALSADTAQAFTTGTHAFGYVLTGVDLSLGGFGSGTRATFSVAIHANDDGAPGTLLGTLLAPDALADERANRFRVQGYIALQANTTYFVVVDGTADGTGHLYQTLSDNQSGAAGWSIADRRLGRPQGGGNWQAADAAARISAIGELLPVPSVGLSASPNPVAEGSSVTVTATLSKVASTANATVIPVTLTADTAEPDDYGTLASIAIAAGATTGTGTVTTMFDADADDETFTIALGTLPSPIMAGTPSSVTVTIDDPDADAVTLISNVAQSTNLSVQPALGTLDVAQSFTTNSNVPGYTLTSVELMLNQLGGSGNAAFTVRIHADADGVPGAVVGALTPPAAFSNNAVNKFTHRGLELAPGTTYFVVVDSTSDGSGTVRTTSSTGHDGVREAGWGIGDDRVSRPRATAGGGWQTGDESVKIRVKGVPTRDSSPTLGSGLLTNQYYARNVAIRPVVLPAATGGNGTLVYSIAPALPAGLSFDPNTRRISGTPTALQDPVNHTYKVTDGDTSNPDSDTKVFSIEVLAPISGLTVVPVDGSISELRASWDAPGGSLSFLEVNRRVSGSGLYQINTAALLYSDATSHKIGGLTAGTAYDVQVLAFAPGSVAVGVAEASGTTNQDFASNPNPAASVRAGPSPATEGGKASFTVDLSRPAPDVGIDGGLSVGVRVSDPGGRLHAHYSDPDTFRAVVVPAGGRSYTWTMTTVQDYDDLPASDVTVELVDGDGYVVDNRARSASVQVVDDDPDRRATVSAAEARVAEGEAARFAVRLSDPAQTWLDVSLRVSETGAGNYVLAGDEGDVRLRFAPGDTERTHAVPTRDDGAAGRDGTVAATVLDGTGFDLGDPASASVAVEDAGNRDPDPQPGVLEGLTATAPNGLANHLDASWDEYRDNTGRAAASYRLEWSGGSATTTGTSHRISGLAPDTAYRVTVSALNAGGTVVGSSEADARTHPARFEFWVDHAPVAIAENGGSVTYEVGMRGAIGKPDNVFEIRGNFFAGTVTAEPWPEIRPERDFNATRYITLHAVDDDEYNNPPRSVVIHHLLWNVRANVAATDGFLKTVTLNDDEEPAIRTATIAAGTSPVTEGADATFTVRLDEAAEGDLSVGVNVSEQSFDGAFMTAGRSARMEVPVAAGAATGTLAVETSDDGVDEADGEIVARIERSYEYELGATREATVKVLDNDGDPSLTIEPTYQTITEGATAEVTLRLAANAPAGGVTVGMWVAQGNDDDVLPADGEGRRSATIAAGQRTATVRVETVDDDADEADATVDVILAGGTGYTRSGLAVAQITVRDNDAAASGVAFLPAASGAGRGGVLRVLNRSPRPATLAIRAFDDRGTPAGPATLHLAAGAAAVLDAADLENGNPSKGLSGGFGDGQGDWRLALGSDPGIEAHAYARAPDASLAPLGDALRLGAAPRTVPTFNPAGDPAQTSWLRLVNPGAADAVVTIEGIDDAGATPGTPVRIRVPAGWSVRATAAELEAGADGAGALGDGHGRWRLLLRSDRPVLAMSLLESPDGRLTNLTRGAAPEGGGRHAAPLFPGAADPLGRRGLVRVLNRSAVAGEVSIQAYDASGRSYAPLALALGAGAAAHFDTFELEFGARAAFGQRAPALAGSTGPGVGDWRLVLSSDLDIEVLSYVLDPDGHLTPARQLCAPRDPLAAAGNCRWTGWAPADR